MTPEDVAYFRSVLTDAGVETGSEALDGHNVDWLRKYRGQATVALKFGDVTEYDRLAGALLTACRRYDHVPEVFSPNSPMTELRRWRTYGYESEGPFLWGAAFVWECAHKRAKAQNPALYDPSVMDLTRV